MLCPRLAQSREAGSIEPPDAHRLPTRLFRGNAHVHNLVRWCMGDRQTSQSSPALLRSVNKEQSFSLNRHHAFPSCSRDDGARRVNHQQGQRGPPADRRRTRRKTLRHFDVRERRAGTVADHDRWLPGLRISSRRNNLGLQTFERRARQFATPKFTIYFPHNPRGVQLLTARRNRILDSRVNSVKN